MIEKLNEILRKLIGRYDICGTVYTGTPIQTEVEPHVGTQVNKLTLAAGTYILSCNMQFSISSSMPTIVSVQQPGVRTLMVERGTMVNGGGHSLCGIIEFAGGEIVAVVQHGHTEAVKVQQNELKAIRIK